MTMIALLAGCGATHSMPPTTAVGLNPGSESAAGLAPGELTITIPAATAQRGIRQPRYLTPNVQGASIDITNAFHEAWFQFYALTTQATYCSTGSQGLTCSLTFNAPPGVDTITVTTYDGASPGANPISYVSLPNQTVTMDATNTFNFVTEGIVTNLAMWITNPFPPSGISLTQPIQTIPVDADGNVIVGTFAVPVALSTSPFVTAATISATSLTSSSTLVNIAYNGASMSAQAQQVAAAIDNVSGANTAFSSAIFQAGGNGLYATPGGLYFPSTTAPAQSTTLAGAGYAAPYTLSLTQPALPLTTLPSCAGIVTVTGSSPTYTVTPVKAGACALGILDSAGASANEAAELPVVVSSYVAPAPTPTPVATATPIALLTTLDGDTNVSGAAVLGGSSMRNAYYFQTTTQGNTTTTTLRSWDGSTAATVTLPNECAAGFSSDTQNIVALSPAPNGGVWVQSDESANYANSTVCMNYDATYVSSTGALSGFALPVSTEEPLLFGTDSSGSLWMLANVPPSGTGAYTVSTAGVVTTVPAAAVPPSGQGIAVPGKTGIYFNGTTGLDYDNGSTISQLVNWTESYLLALPDGDIVAYGGTPAFYTGGTTATALTGWPTIFSVAADPTTADGVFLGSDTPLVYYAVGPTVSAQLYTANAGTVWLGVSNDGTRLYFDGPLPSAPTVPVIGYINVTPVVRH